MQIAGAHFLRTIGVNSMERGSSRSNAGAVIMIDRAWGRVVTMISKDSGTVLRAAPWSCSGATRPSSGTGILASDGQDLLYNTVVEWMIRISPYDDDWPGLAIRRMVA